MITIITITHVSRHHHDTDNDYPFLHIRHFYVELFFDVRKVYGAKVGNSRMSKNEVDGDRVSEMRSVRELS